MNLSLIGEGREPALLIYTILPAQEHFHIYSELCIWVADLVF